MPALARAAPATARLDVEHALSSPSTRLSSAHWASPLRVRRGAHHRVTKRPLSSSVCRSPFRSSSFHAAGHSMPLPERGHLASAPRAIRLMQVSINSRETRGTRGRSSAGAQHGGRPRGANPRSTGVVSRGSVRSPAPHRIQATQHCSAHHASDADGPYSHHTTREMDGASGDRDAPPRAGPEARHHHDG